MKVYHGSYTEVRTPLVGVGRKSLDFGPGFYVTNIKEQAMKWAKRVCIIRNSNSPLLNVYNLNIDVIEKETFKVLSLPKYDKKWLDFVVICRNGQKLWENYDLIQGGIANDQVIDTVEDYYSGRITAEQALGQLRFAKPTNQICILKQEIVDKYLQFEKSMKL